MTKPRSIDLPLRPLLGTLVVLVVAVALPLAAAGAASADVPEGWSDPDEVNPLAFLLVVLGFPALLLVLIALAIYLPPIVRGESVTPTALRGEGEWFGGRRDSEKALAAGGSTAGELPAPDDTGGASGRW